MAVGPHAPSRQSLSVPSALAGPTNQPVRAQIQPAAWNQAFAKEVAGEFSRPFDLGGTESASLLQLDAQERPAAPSPIRRGATRTRLLRLRCCKKLEAVPCTKRPGCYSVLL